MKKWDEILIRVVIPTLIAWGSWVTSTLFDLRSDIKLLLLKANLTVADATLTVPKKNGPTLNAEIGLPIQRFWSGTVDKTETNSKGAEDARK